MPTVDPYCVSGAGSSQANGTYSYSAAVNSGAGGWEKVGNANIFFGYDYDYDSFRFIDTTSGYQTLYVGNFYQNNLSLVTWSVSSGGSAPVPTFTAGECASPTTTTTTTTTPAPSYVNFPTSPSTGQTYSFNGTIWIWNGVGWKKRLILPSQDIFMSSNYGGL